MQQQTHAEQAGAVTPESDHSSAFLKLKATTLAEAALAGLSVFELADGSFLVSRWGWLKTCPNLHAVRAVLCQLKGGDHGV